MDTAFGKDYRGIKRLNIFEILTERFTTLPDYIIIQKDSYMEKQFPSLKNNGGFLMEENLLGNECQSSPMRLCEEKEGCVADNELGITARVRKFSGNSVNAVFQDFSYWDTLTGVEERKNIYFDKSICVADKVRWGRLLSFLVTILPEDERKIIPDFYVYTTMLKALYHTFNSDMVHIDTLASEYTGEKVITLDLTEESYGARHFTIENHCVEKRNRESFLTFGKKQHMVDYLSAMIESPVFVKNAEPDESWLYREYDLNCFSLCLPCRLLGEDMHDDTGVAVKEDSVTGYIEVLRRLTQAIYEDLSHKAMSRCPQI
jgi:hypothetical protein